VRLQAALVLGDRANDDPRAIATLAELASRDAADTWMRLGILSGLGRSAFRFLREWVSTKPALLESPSPEHVQLLEEIAAILGVRRREDELLGLLNLLGKTDRAETRALQAPIGRLALLSGLGEGLERSGSPLHVWLVQPSLRQKQEVQGIAFLWPAALRLAVSDQQVEWRRVAFSALVHGAAKQAESVVPQLLERKEPPVLQSAAAHAIGKLASRELATRIMDSWSDYSLGTRRELLGSLVASPALAGVLVNAIEQTRIAPLELDAATREALLRLPDPAFRKRAETLLTRAAPADRSTIVARYQAALRLTGDAGRGAALFAKNCHTCHQHQGQGHRVGPDLSGFAGR
jgi:hypothetical protein